MSFASNGLLSKPVALLDPPGDRQSPDANNDASFSFVPNGLLSGVLNSGSLASEYSAAPLLEPQNFLDTKIPRDTTTLDEDTIVDGHLSSLPSQPLPSTHPPQTFDRVDPRLVRGKNFDGRVVFFARRQNRDRHVLTVSFVLIPVL